MSAVRYGILGGGFGMYGYLPAAAALPGAGVSTFARYRETVEGRTELRAYVERVRFHDSFAEILADSDVVILALPPFEQERRLLEIMARRWPGRLILEKPLAADPAAAQRLFEALRAARYEFRIGFSFVWTDWFRQLAGWLDEGGSQEISLRWQFRAHHYRHEMKGWKRNPGQGGGALRFYGIQMIAAAAKLGPWEVAGCRRAGSPDDERACEFSLDQGGARISFHCDSDDSSGPRFTLRRRGAGMEECGIIRDGPFPPAGGPAQDDTRVAMLRCVLQSLAGDGAPEYEWYARHLQMWSELERRAAKP